MKNERSASGIRRRPLSLPSFSFLVSHYPPSTPEPPLFLHNVHYWLKPELAPAERQVFLDGIADLMKLASVRHAWFGTPASGGEAIAERGYDYGLVLDLGDAGGHDAFQADPAHQAIRDRIGASWDRIVIYDVSG